MRLSGARGLVELGHGGLAGKHLVAGRLCGRVCPRRPMGDSRRSLCGCRLRGRGGCGRADHRSGESAHDSTRQSTRDWARGNIGYLAGA